MAATKGDIIAGVVVLGIAGFVGWEFFHHPATGKEFTDHSPVENRTYTGTNYNTVVNSADGYNVTLTKGVNGALVSGDYFIYTNGTGSNTPTATGYAYLWGSPLVNGKPSLVTLASIGYTPPKNIKYSG